MFNVEELFNELFLKKAKLFSSLILESCESFDEFHIFSEEFDELYNELPTKVLACVKWNKLEAILFANKEFFKSHLFCLDWFKFVYMLKFDKVCDKVFLFTSFKSFKFKVNDLWLKLKFGL